MIPLLALSHVLCILFGLYIGWMFLSSDKPKSIDDLEIELAGLKNKLRTWEKITNIRGDTVEQYQKDHMNLGKLEKQIEILKKQNETQTHN